MWTAPIIVFRIGSIIEVKLDGRENGVRIGSRIVLTSVLELFKNWLWKWNAAACSCGAIEVKGIIKIVVCQSDKIYIYSTKF